MSMTIVEHIARLNSEMGAVQLSVENIEKSICLIEKNMVVITADVATTTANIKWLTRFQVWTLGLLGSGLIALICFVFLS